MLRIVEAELHVTGKKNGTALADLLLDLLAQRIHNPFSLRSARSCGVRMNISTK